GVVDATHFGVRGRSEEFFQSFLQLAPLLGSQLRRLDDLVLFYHWVNDYRPLLPRAFAKAISELAGPTEALRPVFRIQVGNVRIREDRVRAERILQVFGIALDVAAGDQHSKPD